MQYEEFSEDGKKFIDYFRNFVKNCEYVSFFISLDKKFLLIEGGKYIAIDSMSLLSMIVFMFPNIVIREQYEIVNLLQNKNFFLEKNSHINTFIPIEGQIL